MIEKAAFTLVRLTELSSPEPVSKEYAVEVLGLRAYPDLLIALGAVDVPLPIASEAELAAQVKTNGRIWKNS